MRRRVIAEHVIPAVRLTMRLKASVSEFVFTAAMPPVCSASSRRLPCDIISSAMRSVCALNGPAGEAGDGRVRTSGVRIAGTAGQFGRAAARHLHELVGHADQPARIDRVEVHVGARRHRDRILRRADDVARALPAERVLNGVIDAFAEEQDRLAAAPHRGQELRGEPERVEHADRAESALEIGRLEPAVPAGIGRRPPARSPCPGTLFVLDHESRW